jgi:hypothetical protein
MASKALMMSIVRIKVLCTDLWELMPSFMLCMRFVSSVVVKW